MNAPDFAVSFERPPVAVAPAYFANIFACQAAEYTYTKCYPKLWEAIRLLEVIYGTGRAGFYRIVDLSLGFLEATELNDYKRWDQITHAEWNAFTLSNSKLPQEFVTIIMECQADMLRSCGRDSEIWVRLFSKTPNTQTFIEALSDKPRSIDSSVFRDLIIPKIVTNIEGQNHWANNNIQTQIDGTILFGPQIAKQMLEQVRIHLMESPAVETLYSDIYKKTRAIMNIAGDTPTEEDTLKLFQTVHVDVSLVEAGIIELVNLKFHLLIKNYGEIYRVLATQKAKKRQPEQQGRLGDPNYEFLLSGYVYFATLFFQTIPADMKKVPEYKKGDISRLSQLFQNELGLTRKAVEMIATPQPVVAPVKE